MRSSATASAPSVARGREGPARELARAPVSGAGRPLRLVPSAGPVPAAPDDDDARRLDRRARPAPARRAALDDRHRGPPGRHRGRQRGLAPLRPGERGGARGGRGRRPELLRDLPRRGARRVPGRPAGRRGHHPRAAARAADLHPRLRLPGRGGAALVHADGDAARERRGDRPHRHHRPPAHRDVGGRPHRDRPRAGRRPRARGGGAADRVLGGAGVRRPALHALPARAGGGPPRLHRGGGVGDPADWRGQAVLLGEGVVGRAVAEERSVWTPDVLTDLKISLPDVGGGPDPRRRVPLGARGAVESGRAGHRGAEPGRRGRSDLHRGRAGPAGRLRGAGGGGARELGAVPRDPRRARFSPVDHRELAGRDHHHRPGGPRHLLQPGRRDHVRVPGGGDDRHLGRRALPGRPGGGPGGQAAGGAGRPAAQLRERVPRQGRPARGDQRVDLGAARHERSRGRHARSAQGHRASGGGSRSSSASPRRWRRSGGSRAASRTTSTTC